MKCKLLCISFSILSAIFLFSCKSIPKDITYFEDMTEKKVLQGTIINNTNELAKIIPNDRLRIIVSSTNRTDIEVLSQFNLAPLTYLAPYDNSLMNDVQFQTYLVDKNGEINYPVLGKVKVEGLTVLELMAFFEEKMKEYISDPVVNISLLSFRINVMGEVKSPGIVNVGNNPISILDAIGYAGDLTIYGDRKNVKLIRNNNGLVEYALLDLTSSNLFSSPYFYLKQNDIIVVDPNTTRKKDSAYGSSDNYKLSVISTVLGSISILVSTVLLFFR